MAQMLYVNLSYTTFISLRYIYFFKKAVNVLAVQKLKAHDRYLKNSASESIVYVINVNFQL